MTSGSSADSPLIVASDLSRCFRVRVDGNGAVDSLRRFLKPLYTVVKALDSVSFEIRRGEAVGYVGLNGAGKSTTIKLMCGVLVPTSGEVRVAGMEPHRRRIAVSRRIGLMMGQRSQLLWDLPVRESFYLLGRIYDMKPADYRASVERLVDTLDIGSLWNTPVRTLSLGQKTRCDLALTFLHRPEAVFLDEPTIGLDVIARERIRDFLRSDRERGTTIFLASHDLDDLEIVADRVMLVHRGKLLFDGTKVGLLQAIGGNPCTLEDAVKRFYKEASLG